MTRRTAVVIGAGLAGSLMAIFLARRGFAVEVFERRPDPRVDAGEDGARSINLGMSARALAALRAVDLLDPVMARTVPMRGRVLHRPDGRLGFQPYGTDDGQILHSILRHDLNVTLIERALTFPHVRFTFGAPFTRMDRDKERPVCFVAVNGVERAVPGEFVVGADGVHSRVRRELQAGIRADYHQEFLSWGYKEISVPAGPDGRPRTRLEALHVWPGDDGLIVAHPNLDGSLTGTVFLPHDGVNSFDTIRTPERIRRFFTDRWPDTVTLMPDLVDEFLTHPVGNLVTVRTAPWRYQDRVVLLGDAAHAVYPFYGQGMNAAFEDCRVLDECLGRGGPAAAFAEFERRRRPHTDVLADLSKRNFLELRDGVRSPVKRARARADLLLNRVLPRNWLPLYTMVSHTDIPYADALARARRQDAALGVLGVGVAAALGVASFANRKGAHADRSR